MISTRKCYRRFLMLGAFVLFLSDGYSQNTLFELYGRKTKDGQIEYKSVSLLFNRNGRSYQNVLARYTATQEGRISFSVSGKEVLSAVVKKGNNLYLIPVPAVSKPRDIDVSARIDGGPVKKQEVELKPAKQWHIYFVQHTHTDIGYTHPQSEVLAEHMRYIDYALDYCDQTDSLPDEARFRWTCESSWVVKEYLRSRPAAQIERLKKRVAEKRIEITGLAFNMAEISDENIMYDFLQPLREIREHGIEVTTAMQDDVNGIAWCIPDYLKNTGVKYLSMGINETRSILPFGVPTPFWWESPSGARLLAFRSEHYMTGNFFKIEDASEDFEERMMWYLADLESKGYPYDRIAIQYSGYFTDNSPPSLPSSELIRNWQNKYEYPRLRLAVVSDFLEYVEKHYAKQLPVYRNAWLDWWTDGFASTSRETAETRKTQNLKQAGEGLFAMVSMLGGKLSEETQSAMQHISENALFFAEHTVGADESIQRPYSENSTKQWLQKGAYAWEAVKQTTLLNEEALARMQKFLPRAQEPLIYVINTLGWPRSGTVEVFAEYALLSASGSARLVDLTTGKTVGAQMVKKRREGAYWVMEVSDVPALGVKAFSIEREEKDGGAEESAGVNTEILENRYYKVEIDRQTGSISSLFDKELGMDLADKTSKWGIGQLVRETIPHRDSMGSAAHSSVIAVSVKPGDDGALWQSVRIAADMPGFEKGKPGEPRGIELELRLYKHTKKIGFRFHGRKELLTDPEGLYVAFPFAMPDSRIVFETTGGILSQGEQLPGSSSDWNVAQNFVAVRGKKGQVILVSDEIPLWQFSELNLGKFERYPQRGKPTLYSWVMNNYWFTNFRAAQEGAFSWSYELTSTGDTTDSYATKYSWSQRIPFFTRTVLPGEKAEAGSSIIKTISVDAPSNALLVNSRPSFAAPGKILLHFRELEGKDAEVKISSAIGQRTVSGLTEVNVLGEEIRKGLVSVKLMPFEVKFIEVEFRNNK